MVRLTPKVGEYYKSVGGFYAYIVTEVTEYEYRFKYVHPRVDSFINTFNIEEFSEVAMTELEKALL